MSFDPDTPSDAELDENSKTNELLEEILKVLKQIEAHMAEITEEEFEEDDTD